MLLGRYCANCSQAADVHVPTTLELVHEMLEGVLHTDSRLWRTLKSLYFRPGKLTQEFVAGRRAAYLPPFRLYLVVSVSFFLLASLSHPPREDAHDAAAANSVLTDPGRCDAIRVDALASHPGFNERLHPACREVARDHGASLRHGALATMSKAMFIFLPLIALLDMLLYWRPRYRYAEHVVFFLHLHAFFFSAAILDLAAINAPYLWPSAQGAAAALESLLGWVALGYTVVAVRRVFAQSWPGALFKSLALAVVYLAVFSVTVAGAFVYTMLQL